MFTSATSACLVNHSITTCVLRIATAATTTMPVVEDAANIELNLPLALVGAVVVVHMTFMMGEIITTIEA